MEVKLTAPSNFKRIKQLDSLYVPRIQRLSPLDQVIIDLSKITFIKPLGVIGILTLIERLTQLENGMPNIELICPENKEVIDYLVKIDFINALETLCDWDIPDDIEVIGKKLKPVIPITRFSDANDIEIIANQMQEIFHTELMGLSTLLQPCHVVYSELAINAVEHANSNGGFVLAQQFEYHDGSRLEISVGDSGIGIHKSLKQNKIMKGKFKSDREAIMSTLSGGLSRINDPHRGYGLYWVKEELGDSPNRSLTLRSGNGYVIIYTGNRPYSAKCKSFPGTIAHVVIPCG